jgi:hypothetical protein
MKFSFMRQRFVRPTGARAQRPRRGLMLSLVLLTAAAATGVFAPAAAADQPDMFQFAFDSTGTLTGVCSFDITVDSSVSARGEDFFDKSGALIREILTPDHGGVVNLAGFCAALSP